MPVERNDNITAINFSNFTGGINVSLPAMLIGENDAQMLKNVEYDYTRLRTRGGLSAPILTLDNDIKHLWYDKTLNRYVVVDNQKKVYISDLDNNQPINVGTLNGTLTPCFEKFDGNVFIASGGLLQYIDYTDNTLKTISRSKNCNNVFDRNGRLVTTQEGDDNQYYSAVGDAYSESAWTNNSNDESSSQWLEVGYKDDGDIITSVSLSQDLIVFKSNGRVYDVTGDSPNWNVAQTAENAFAINKDCILQVMNNVVFLTESGLKNLSTTQTYGNFSVGELGYKFNSLLVKNLHNPKMWNFVNKRQLVIRPNDNTSNELFIYQYNMDSGFYVNFSMPIVDMAESQNGVIIASGKSLHRWSFQYKDDNGVPIEQQIITRRVMAQDRFITRRTDISLSGTEGNATFRLVKEKFKYDLSKDRKIKEIYTNSRYIELEVVSNNQMALNTIVVYAINN